MPQQIPQQPQPAQSVDLDTDLFGMFEVVSAVPAGVPRMLYDQVKIYTNGTTYRLYWYDTVGHAWHYATGT
jgi:hypothetical protein